MGKLNGKVAVVTGAGSGMGKAIATLYAKEGAKVVLADINEANLEAVSSEITSNGGTSTSIVTNVSNDSDIQAMIDKAVNEYGTIDILVNNAGIMDNFIPVAELTNDHWEKVLSVNLNSVMYGSRAALKVMLEKKNGVIINNASIGGLFGARGGSAYIASKHAVIGITKNIAATYSDYGIRCNAIAPGGVETNIASGITAPSPVGFAAIQKAGEAPMGKAEEIAQVALFLASNDSSFVNGTTITADGGWTTR